MYQTSDIRKGLKVEMDGIPYVIVEFQFVKPGKGTAFTRTRFKNLLTGAVIERNLRTGEQLAPADIETLNMQYLYKEGDMFQFMNLESYDQIGVTEKALGDNKDWLLEEMTCQVMLYKGEPVSVELPTFVELQVTEADPGVRGNTATGANKTVRVSTGGQIRVPLFIDSGTWVRIDTRTGEYVDRVKK